MEPLSGLPFILAAGAPKQLDKTRIAEAVVIALIVGAIMAMAGKYIALPVLEDKLTRVIKDGEFTRDKVEKLQEKLVALQIEMARRR
mgnify:CR=1 FL=1